MSSLICREWFDTTTKTILNSEFSKIFSHVTNDLKSYLTIVKQLERMHTTARKNFAKNFKIYFDSLDKKTFFSNLMVKLIKRIAPMVISFEKKINVENYKINTGYIFILKKYLE